MTLRPAEFSDASSIATLCIEVWAGTYLKQGIDGFFADYVLEEFTSAKTRDLIADPAQFILVSQNTHGIYGMMRLSSNRGVKWSGKTGQRAKMYPTLKTGYTNDEETQFFRQV